MAALLRKHVKIAGEAGEMGGPYHLPAAEIKRWLQLG